MAKIQLLIEIFTFAVLIVALVINVRYAEEKRDAWHKFKVFALVASLLGLIMWFKDLARFSFVFLIIAIL